VLLSVKKVNFQKKQNAFEKLCPLLFMCFSVTLYNKYTFCVLFFCFSTTLLLLPPLYLDWTGLLVKWTVLLTPVNESTQITEKKHSFLSYSAFERSSTFLTNTESTKKSRGHNFFVLFSTFYIKIMKNHKKSQKSIKKHEKALKSKLGVFLM